MPKRVYSIACVRTLYRYSIVVFIVFRSNIHTLADETIKIYYENKCSFPNSMHPHSIEHNKTSEGAPYNDGSTDGDIWKARDSMVDDSMFPTIAPTVSPTKLPTKHPTPATFNVMTLLFSLSAIVLLLAIIVGLVRRNTNRHSMRMVSSENQLTHSIILHETAV
eukprot:866557_1